MNIVAGIDALLGALRCRLESRLQSGVGDAAADGAAATNLRVGDVIRCFLKNRHPFGNQLLRLQSALARKRADGDTAIARPNVVELFYTVYVDDDVGSRQAHVQKWHQ